MPCYVAFLRGINSGRNSTVKMAILRQAFEGLGFQEVKTILASGNVLFEADSPDEESLENRIEAALPGAIGFQSDVIARRFVDIQQLAESQPFRDITITPDTRIYVTFAKEKPKTDLVLPIVGKGYAILEASYGAVCSTVDLTMTGTPDLMQALEKMLGPHITTRNWNTIEKILAAATIHK